MREDDFILNIPTMMLAYRAIKAPTAARSALCALMRTQFAGARESQCLIADNLQV
jgi:hypothetical protein